ncbi:hypothetical protein AAMO2058_001457700 [Amorphochlora amoebiformis]
MNGEGYNIRRDYQRQTTKLGGVITATVRAMEAGVRSRELFGCRGSPSSGASPLALQLQSLQLQSSRVGTPKGWPKRITIRRHVPASLKSGASLCLSTKSSPSIPPLPLPLPDTHDRQVGRKRSRSYGSIVPPISIDGKKRLDSTFQSGLEPPNRNCRPRNRTTIMRLNTLRVSIPKTLKFQDRRASQTFTQGGEVSGRPNACFGARGNIGTVQRGERSRNTSRSYDPPVPANPLMTSRKPSAYQESSRPLHLWKPRHVARWAKRFAPDDVTMVLKKRLDGERLLRVVKEDDLVELGFVKCKSSGLSSLLRELQTLQTKDILWHLNTLKDDAGKLHYRSG